VAVKTSTESERYRRGDADASGTEPGVAAGVTAGEPSRRPRRTDHGVTRMYEFENLPLSSIEPATNLLISGPAMSGAEELFARMLRPGADDEGTIVVSTGTGAGKLYDRFQETAGSIDRRRFGVVDCVSRQQGQSVEGENLRSVSSPRDLTGIGMELSDLYESFYGRGLQGVRTGLESISTLLMYAELSTLFRFLHVFTGRISTADGLGVFVIDPTSHDDQTTGTIFQLFDGRIDVREQEGDRQLRVQGLADQSGEWTTF
jgi:hypothetical protein